MYPTEPFVRRVLGPYERELSSIFHDAWDRLQRNPDRSSFDLKRTVAVNMHQNVMNAVRAIYSDSDSVKLLEEHETIRLLIERQLIVRLKKMDQRGYARAHPSQALLALTNVSPLPFSHTDFPDIYAVDFGWVPNDLETRIESILVAARFGDAVIWSYLANSEADEAPIVGTIVPPAGPAGPPKAGTIIRLPVERKDRKDDEQK